MITARIRNSTAFLSTDSNTTVRIRGEIVLPAIPPNDDARLHVVVRDQAGRILHADYHFVRVHTARDGLMPFEEKVYIDDEFESLELEVYAEVRVSVLTDVCRTSLDGAGGTADLICGSPKPADMGDDLENGATDRIDNRPAQLRTTPPDPTRAQPPPARSLKPGDPLGRYRIRLKVCNWEHGAIYVADHRNLNKTVLIKVTGANGPGRDILATEAERRIREASQLVTIDDLGSQGPLSYLLVAIGIDELVDEASNSSVLEALGIEPVARILEVGMENARALVAAALSPWRPD